MTEIYQKIRSALLGVMLVWGCNGDGTLLDNYPMEPIVNPEVGLLIQDNRIIHARVGGRQGVSGITEKGIFETVDGFRSFDFEPHAWQGAAGLVVFGAHLIVQVRDDGGALSLRYSADNGKTWAAYGKPIVTEQDRVLGDIDVVQLVAINDHSVWLLCRQSVGMEQRLLLYDVDLAAEVSELLFSTTGALALAADVSAEGWGWLIGRSAGEETGSAQVWRTEDGGQTWLDGASLTGIEQPSVVAMDEDRVLVYNREGVAFLSDDGGVTFEPVAVGMGVVACQAVSPDVAYALLETGLSKSTDGGHSWTPVEAWVHGIEVSGTSMDFHGERSGAVFSDDRLFVTHDGGQSWDVLVYPYDYVFDDGP